MGYTLSGNHISGKLAVILHADVASSTALVQKDERLAHQRIQAAFQRFSKIIARYQGRVRELRGDALLAEFARASDAVSAALNFQTDQASQIAQIHDPIRPTVRVGIAMGEVILADNTVTGAGVILAQRVEQLAEPGKVCITGAVQEALPMRLPIERRSLGEQQVKGFNAPVHVYTLQLREGAAPPEPTQRFRESQWPIVPLMIATVAAIVLGGTLLVLYQPWISEVESTKVRDASGALDSEVSLFPGRSSIAVLPFDNLSRDTAVDYISDGLTEDLIHALGRYPSLAVLAFGAVLPYRDQRANSSAIRESLGATFLVEGSVRQVEGHLLVSARLIDARSGVLLWSERFVDEKDDLFAVQDALTGRIVGTLVSNLTRVEQERTLTKPTSNLDAYHLVLRGRAKLKLATRKSNREARETFQRAIDLDSNYASAYAWLARAHYEMATDGWTEFPDDALTRAENLARKALRLDSDLVEALRTISRIHAIQFQLDRAKTEIDRAIELNPSDAEAHGDQGLISLWAGEVEEAVKSFETAFTFDPNLRGDYVFAHGLAYYSLKRHEEAIDVLERGMARYPNYPFIPVVLVAAYGQLGRLDDAHRYMEQVKQLLPFFRPETFGSRFQDKKLYDYLVEGLRKGGFQ